MSPTRPATKEYLAPFAVFVAMLAVTDFLPQPAKYWLYPVQTFLCGALVIWFWPVYRFEVPKKVVFTVITAIIVLVLWISPQVFFRQPLRFTGFDPTVFTGNPSLYYSVVALRFLRLVVVVPFVEEIFWRGFLLRFLVKEDFESVRPGTFTWLSFSAVTAGFCFEHSPADRPAALLTGVLFNFVYYRTRSFASCVLVHAVANFLLGIYIMRTGQWGFW